MKIKTKHSRALIRTNNQISDGNQLCDLFNSILSVFSVFLPKKLKVKSQKPCLATVAASDNLTLKTWNIEFAVCFAIKSEFEIQILNIEFVRSLLCPVAQF